MRRHSLLLAALAGLAVAGCEDDDIPPVTSPDVPIATQLQLRDDMRQLWTEHVLWTRIYIMAVVSNGPDAQAAADRLFQNQGDIGNAIKPYYGEAAGNQLTELLKQHIQQAADLLAAVKAGDNAKAAEVKAAWYSNADQIAVFLASANPFWPLADMSAMMRQHLDLTLAEATAQFMADWNADVAAYDAVVTEINAMADMLSSGIAMQFPVKVTVDTQTATATALHTAMRKLWQDHVMWTRVYLIDDIDSLPGKSAAAARLLQNQVDLGNAVKPYYGTAAGDMLAALLKEHILGAVAVLAAAEAGDMAALAKAQANWVANADRISNFLADANPNLDRAALTQMMREHLDQTYTEAAKRLGKDYAGEVTAYDIVERHILHMSDTLSAAIDAQFPNGPPAMTSP